MAVTEHQSTPEPRQFCDPGYCRLVGQLDADGEPLNECPAGYCYDQDARKEAQADE